MALTDTQRKNIQALETDTVIEILQNNVQEASCNVFRYSAK